MHHPVDRIRSLEREVKEQLNHLQPMLVDQSCSLNERWDMYSKVAHFMPLGDWYSDGFLEVLGIDSPHDAGFERYQTSYFVDMAENYEENIAWYKDNSELSPKEEGIPSEDQVNAWKEVVLASGRRGFTYDW